MVPRARLCAATPWVVLIWFMSTYWLLGDLGKHPKEYYWCDRDPVSGTITQHYPWHMTSALLQDGQTTHRCFCLVWLDLSATWLSHHLRLGLFMEALGQALVCWSLYRLLRVLRLSAAASAAASLLFLSCPVAVYPRGLSLVMVPTYLFFIMTCIYVRAFPLRHELLAMVFLVAAATPFYEIGGPAYIALPLLFAAVHPHFARPQLRQRMLVPVACMLAVYLAYAWLTVATRDPLRRGGLDSFTPLGELGTKSAVVATHVIENLCLNGLLGGALREGWQRLGQHWGVWCAAYAAAACMWLIWWNHAAQHKEATREPRPRLYLVWLFGVLMAVLPWSLAVLIRMPSYNTRVCYLPLAGAVIAGAATMDLAAEWLRQYRLLIRVYWSAAGLLVLAGSLCGAVCLVGIQSWIQARGQGNLQFIARLHELMPNPPSTAFFLPISLCPPQPDAESRARQNHVDKYCPPLWGDTVAATLALDFAYHRRDINCWQVSGKTMEDLERWPELDVDNGEVFQTANSRCFSIPVIHTNHQQHEFHTWRNVVPLTVDCERNLRLIGTIHLEHADNRDEDIKLPWVNAAASRPDLVGEVALSAPQPGRDAGAYLQWTRLDGGQLVSWEAVQDGAVRRNVAAIPPASAIYATLLPCNQPMYAYWRIHGKQSESFVDVLLGDGVSAQRGTPLAHYSATAAWKPVTVEIKPHSVPQCLVVRGGAAGCMLTQPLNTRTQ